MKYEVTTDPTPENVKRLIVAAAEVEAEWVTIIRFAYDAGIKSSLGRHLGPSNVSENQMLLKHQLSRAVLKRTLPADLLQYLNTLPNVDTHYCPKLHNMSTIEFHNSWRSVCAKAGFVIQLLVLHRPYRNEHRADLKWERTIANLEQLASLYLKDSQIQMLRRKASEWALMGAKKGNRRRRLNRAQIMAPIKSFSNTEK